MLYLIQIEDTPNGVAIKANPGMREILRMPPNEVTSAGAYMLAALNAIERLAEKGENGNDAG